MMLTISWLIYFSSMLTISSFSATALRPAASRPAVILAKTTGQDQIAYSPASTNKNVGPMFPEHEKHLYPLLSYVRGARLRWDTDQQPGKSITSSTNCYKYMLGKLYGINANLTKSYVHWQLQPMATLAPKTHICTKLLLNELFDF